MCAQEGFFWGDREVKPPTNSTEPTNKADDIDSNRRVLVGFDEKHISAVVKEFLQDGGKASLEQFLDEFPDAILFGPPYPIIPAEGGQKITFDEVIAEQEEVGEHEAACT